MTEAELFETLGRKEAELQEERSKVEKFKMSFLGLVGTIQGIKEGKIDPRRLEVLPNGTGIKVLEKVPEEKLQLQGVKTESK